MFDSKVNPYVFSNTIIISKTKSAPLSNPAKFICRKGLVFELDLIKHQQSVFFAPLFNVLANLHQINDMCNFLFFYQTLGWIVRSYTASYSSAWLWFALPGRRSKANTWKVRPLSNTLVHPNL